MQGKQYAAQTIAGGFSPVHLGPDDSAPSTARAAALVVSQGNENREFDDNGLRAVRHASINDLPIKAEDRKFF